MDSHVLDPWQVFGNEDDEPAQVAWPDRLITVLEAGLIAKKPLGQVDTIGNVGMLIPTKKRGVFLQLCKPGGRIGFVLVAVCGHERQAEALSESIFGRVLPGNYELH